MFLFKKRKNNNDLKAFINGDLISIDQVNDDVFSQKMMGDGIAIKPKGNEVYAPCDGKITAIFDSTEHAVGLTLDNGMEILIHCGLDTVNLTEKVFSCKVTKEQKVKQYIIIDYKDFDLSSDEKNELFEVAKKYCEMKDIPQGDQLEITLLDNDEAEDFLEKVFNNMRVIKGLITKRD